MYETFFGLNRRPFAPGPRVDAYFPAAAIDAARQALTRCIERGEGVGMVVGPSGTGKTLLCQLLAAAFGDRLDVVLLSSGGLGSRRSLLQGILHGLERPYRGMDEGELRLALVDYLTKGEVPCRGLLLLVDEAHGLPLRCLDELRAITNLVADGQARTRLVLAGAGVLEERLANPKLDSLSQRLAARCYLEAFGRGETEGFIHFQIAGAGGDARAIFPPAACEAVYQATGGVPRLVNQVCDHALVLAFAAGLRQVDPDRVQEAWSDLQQLPTPWNGVAGKSDGPTAVVEFGALEDESAQELPDRAGQGAGPSANQAAAIPAPTEVSNRAAPEPVEQIGQIQQMLGQLDGGLHAEHATGSEVELVLDHPANPFSEPFEEEEEVVVDRHAALAEQPSAGGPPTLPLRRKDGVVGLEPEAPELVIEDDYDFVEPAEVHPVKPVRRHEYRQLFARLRRGERL